MMHIRLSRQNQSERQRCNTLNSAPAQTLISMLFYAFGRRNFASLLCIFLKIFWRYYQDIGAGAPHDRF